MKPRFQERMADQGSVLMAALFIACILGVGLASCLVMVRFERDAAVRSEAWNAALIMAEGGVEEALAQLNPGACAAPCADGAYGPLSRNLAGGSYDVTYTMANSAAMIYATGRVVVPSLSATLTRVVEVAATNAPLFTAAIGAQGPIDLNGAGLSTDSFNSADPAHSNNGQYPGHLSSKTLANGDVATEAGLSGVGGGHIHGNLFLGPAAPSGSGTPSSVSGSVHHDLNVDFPSVVAPSTAGWLQAGPAAYPTNGTTYANSFLLPGTWSYTIPQLNGSLYVGPGVEVTLLTSGNAALGDIFIDGGVNNPGKLTIYMAGASFSVNGDMTVASGLAAGFTYFGLPGNTSISFNGSQNVVGTIYAPGSDLAFVNEWDGWYWGQDTFNFIGSCVTKSVSADGYTWCRFHYDENLKHAGTTPRRGYLATAWQELH